MREKVHYLDLEGLAINGLIEKVSLEDCNRDNKIRKSKILAVTKDGREIETECIDYSRIVRIWIIVKQYEKWGKQISEGESAEEFISEYEKT
ncbi:MAG: hypothetical protein ACP5GI_00855 [Sulfolobales archaeon]